MTSCSLCCKKVQTGEFFDEETHLCFDCFLPASEAEESSSSKTEAKTSSEVVFDFSANGKKCRACGQKLAKSHYKKPSDEVCAICKDAAIKSAEFVKNHKYQDETRAADVEKAIEHLLSVDEFEFASEIF